MKTRTWYLHEKEFPFHSFCIPGARMTSQEEAEARTILDHVTRVVGQRFGGYRALIPGLGLGDGDLVVRGHRIATARGAFHALREIPNIVPQLQGGPFSYPAWLQRQLLGVDLSAGGLLLICGSAGTGKSTTMAATVVSRLRAYGSMAIAIEDPPEYDLQGMHGTGNCLQMPAEAPEQFPDLIMDALRCYPAAVSGVMLMVSEIRNSETAALVLEAALSGHLVLSSIHAAGVESALARLVSLASQTLGATVARADAAEAVRLVVHQKRGQQGVSFTALKNVGDPSVASKIREGQFHMLTADVQRQAAAMMTAGV